MTTRSSEKNMTLGIPGRTDGLIQSVFSFAMGSDSSHLVGVIEAGFQTVPLLVPQKPFHLRQTEIVGHLIKSTWYTMGNLELFSPLLTHTSISRESWRVPQAKRTGSPSLSQVHPESPSIEGQERGAGYLNLERALEVSPM